jgi:predicted NUDIX family NTP pyrophosphohydrolase
VPRTSAGILLFRKRDAAIEVLLAHMGGPLWQRRDDGAWSIPKGEYAPPEPALDAARREFAEELGLLVPPGDLVSLGDAKQSSGKIITVWALEGELDPEAIAPGTFRMEWPPRSATLRDFPEVDRVAWFDVATARRKLVTGQRAFLDRLADHAAG